MTYLLFFIDSGAPQAGLSPVIVTYKKVSDGSDVTPVPAVTEIGGGFYKFDATPTEGMVVVIDGTETLSNTDRYQATQISPADIYLDAPISTRALESGGNLAAVKAKTDNLSDPAQVVGGNTVVAG